MDEELFVKLVNELAYAYRISTALTRSANSAASAAYFSAAANELPLGAANDRLVGEPISRAGSAQNVRAQAEQRARAVWNSPIYAAAFAEYQRRWGQFGRWTFGDYTVAGNNGYGIEDFNRATQIIADAQFGSSTSSLPWAQKVVSGLLIEGLFASGDLVQTFWDRFGEAR